MPVRATTVFFPIEEKSQTNTGQRLIAEVVETPIEDGALDRLISLMRQSQRTAMSVKVVPAQGCLGRGIGE